LEGADGWVVIKSHALLALARRVRSSAWMGIRFAVVLRVLSSLTMLVRVDSERPTMKMVGVSVCFVKALSAPRPMPCVAPTKTAVTPEPATLRDSLLLRTSA
jgi:hypothetical protein